MNTPHPAWICSLLLSAATACAGLPADTPVIAQLPPALPSAAPVAGADAAFNQLKELLTYADVISYSSPTKGDAVIALGLLGDQRAVALLTEHLAHEKNDHLRQLIAKSLGWLRSADAVPALEQALKDPYPHTRKQAALALKSITGRDYPYDTTGLPNPTALQEALRAGRK